MANNSGRLPEKPYGSMNWSPMLNELVTSVNFYGRCVSTR